MCLFGNSKRGSTNAPTVYDGKGPAKKTDQKYTTVKAALKAQNKRNWAYSEEETAAKPEMVFTAQGLRAMPQTTVPVGRAKL